MELLSGHDQSVAHFAPDEDHQDFSVFLVHLVQDTEVAEP
jgi:hypothetical protein